MIDYVGCLRQFSTNRLHYVAAQNLIEEVKQCLLKGCNPYEPVAGSGLTPLHAAIANDARDVTELLLEVYERDLRDAPKEVSCPLLIAHRESDCHIAKSLGIATPTAATAIVIVFLRIPVDGVRFVTLDVSNERLATVFQFVTGLMPNGHLSLDSGDLREDGETFLQVACYCGNVSLVERLVTLGASLTATGRYGRTPFIMACEGGHVAMIKMLLSKYEDRFDPTVCDFDGKGALHVLMEKNCSADLLSTVVAAMLRYRATHYEETERQAFNRIFRYESLFFKSQTIWHFVGNAGQLHDLCCDYVQRFELDLSARWQGTSILADMIERRLALDYCRRKIIENLQLLEIETHDCMNVLHILVIENQLPLVEYLYNEHPQVARVFETERGAFEAMRLVLGQKDGLSRLQLLLTHHADFWEPRADNFRKYIFGRHQYPRSAYGRPFDLLLNACPMLEETVAQARDVATKRHLEQDFDQLFCSLSDAFVNTLEDVKSRGFCLESFRDVHGRNVLHKAVLLNQKVLVANLLENNFDISALDSKGNLALHFVRNDDIFDMLARKMLPTPMQFNDLGYNVLHSCCTQTVSQSLLGKLVKLGFDVNQPTDDGNTPLTLATRCSTIRFLIDRGANVNILRHHLPDLQTGSDCAGLALIPHVRTFDWFQQHAHVYVSRIVSIQRLHRACIRCPKFLEQHEFRHELFDLLFRHSRSDAEELFARMCQLAANDCVGWFLDGAYDIDYNHCNDLGNTPLHSLLSFMVEPNAHLVRRLLEMRANVNAVNHRGETPLLVIAGQFQKARNYDHTLETIQWLLDHGVNVNAQDTNGDTALHLAFREGQLELANLLLHSGADFSLANNRGLVASAAGHANMSFAFAFLR